MAVSLPPSEYFPGIGFNFSFYSTGADAVTLEYINSNFLKSTGYAYSRAIFTNFQGVIYANGGIVGNGAGLTSLNASNISSGTLGVEFGGTGTNTLVSGQLLIGNGTDALLQSEILTWENANNRLGIGKTPSYTLDVSGNIYFIGDLYKNGSLFTNSSQWTTKGNIIYHNSVGNVEIGKTPTYTVDVSGNINFTGNLYKNESVLLVSDIRDQFQVINYL